MMQYNEGMTPYEILRNNLSVLRNKIGTNSYMVTVDFKEDPYMSLGKIGALINNDVHRVMEFEPPNNAKQYFAVINGSMVEVAKEMGKEYENFDEVRQKAEEWCRKNHDPSGTRCPHKFYFTTYCKHNSNIFHRWMAKIGMFLKPHQFVIHVVRDSVLDSYCGGYFIQIHAYHNKATYRPDEWVASEEDRFFNICDKAFKEWFVGTRVPVYFLTDPSIFGRLRHWFKRCYARYNSFLVLLYTNIKYTITGTLLGANK